MKTIWKYPLEWTIGFPQGINIRKGAVIRFVGHDPKIQKICVWAEVDTEAPKVTRAVTIIGTGFGTDKVPPNSHYAGSLIDPTDFVWHVYVEDEK